MSEESVPYVQTVTIQGRIFYVPIEGGFLGFEDKGGNRYDLHGDCVKRLSELVGTSEEGYPMRITGVVVKEAVSIHQWGEVFEVIDYKW